VLAISFGACSTDVSVPKIGLLMDDFEHERWLTDKEILLSELNNRGADVLFRVANGDSEKQRMQAQELLALGAKVLIVVAVDQVEAAEIVRNAHNVSAKVIAYDRLIKRCDLDYYLSFDHINVGRMQARAVVDHVPNPNICVIGGSIHDNNAFMIHAGQNSILEPLRKSGRIAIQSSSFTEYWQEEEGFVATLSALKDNPALNAVLAANDALAAGAIRANDSLCRPPLYVTGMDADADALERIVQNTQSMTVYKPIAELAKKTADLAYKLTIKDSSSVAEFMFVLVNNGQNTVKSLLLETVMVDSSNVSEMLEKF